MPCPKLTPDVEDAELERQEPARDHEPSEQDGRKVTLADMIGTAKGLYGTPEDVLRVRAELRREWP